MFVSIQMPKSGRYNIYYLVLIVLLGRLHYFIHLSISFLIQFPVYVQRTMRFVRMASDSTSRIHRRSDIILR